VAENLRPYEIVNDRAFISLIKTGRPDYQLPSPTTLARDVQNVFLNAKARMAKYLQVSIQSTQMKQCLLDSTELSGLSKFRVRLLDLA
jgi:hypothetical protein